MQAHFRHLRSKSFPMYKERFNSMRFDPCNRSLKIWESTWIPTPKMGIPLGAWGFIPSHSFALLGAWNVTPGLPSWPTLLQVLALVVSLRLGLWHPWTSFKEFWFVNALKSNSPTPIMFLPRNLPMHTTHDSTSIYMRCEIPKKNGKLTSRFPQTFESPKLWSSIV